MLRLLFSNQDNSKQLTVITDGIDGQLNIFVTEDPVGDVEYFKLLGIDINAGITYNIGDFKQWCWNNVLTLIGYGEGLNDEGVMYQNIDVTYEYVLTTNVQSLDFPTEGSTQSFTVTSTKQQKLNGQDDGEPQQVGYTTVVNGEGFSKGSNDTTVIAAANETTEQRSGSVTIIPNEGDGSATITLTQSGTTV